MRGTSLLMGGATLLLSVGCLEPTRSSGADTGGGDNPSETSWTLTQRMPSGGVGEVSVGAAASAEQLRVESPEGRAQVLTPVTDPHTKVTPRPAALNVLATFQEDLVHAHGVPGNP